MTPTPSSPSSSSSSSSSFARRITGKMILAPLTRGGNLPFRRLCADFGMIVSVSEMIYSRSLNRGDPIENARLRRSTNEACYGIQIATNDIAEGSESIALAARSGADFVDLNCGCPIYDATRRGLGSALLRFPDRLGTLVSGLADAARENGGLPLTVKIRLGCDANAINCRDVARIVAEAGASAIAVHGRTAQQGYSRAADWDEIRRIVEDASALAAAAAAPARSLASFGGNGGGIVRNIPIIGNGDILTHVDARRRMAESGVQSVMVGRGALIKPWIFREFQDGRTWMPDDRDRIAVYRRLACYMKEHFGDDDLGKKKSWRFLPWHLDFFARYVPPLKEDDDDEGYVSSFSSNERTTPLIQTRTSSSSSFENADASPLEQLLSYRGEDVHDLIASELWYSSSDSDAYDRLLSLSESAAFTEICDRRPVIVNGGGDGQGGGVGAGTGMDLTTEELANIPPNSTRGKWLTRSRRGTSRRSPPKPKRTPEEIAAVRAERAAKKAALGTSVNDHVNGRRS